MPNQRVTPPQRVNNDNSVRLHALTALRFFAAVMIVILHVDPILRPGGPNVELALQQGVSFFFLLSGFILFYKYHLSVDRSTQLEFFIIRFARILPAYVVSLAIFMIAVPPALWCSLGNHSVWLIVPAITMTQSLIPQSNYFYAINPPSWSISTEFFFYLAFPFLLRNWKQTWFLKIFCCVGFVVGCLFFADYIRGLPISKASKEIFQWSLYINPLVRILEFVVGMVTASVFLRFKDSLSHKIWLINLLQPISVFFACLAVIFCKGTNALSSARILPSAFSYWVEGSGGMFAFALLIFAMAFQQGLVSRVLSKKGLVLLGELSFSVYLLHWLLIQAFLAHWQISSLTLSAPLRYAIYALVVLVCSYCMHYLVEKPARKFIPSVVVSALARRKKSGEFGSEKADKDLEVPALIG